jgi:hypothetical protein
MNYLIEPSQLAYVKGRNIIHGCKSIQAVINYCELHKQNGIIMTVDFSGAFDNINQAYMFRILQSYGFPENIVKRVKMMYNNCQATVIVNSETAGTFPLESGVKQGDPLSAYLFILALNPLLKLILADRDIEWIKMQNFEAKSTSFADDVTFFVKTETDVVKILDYLKLFENISGLPISISKSELMYLGPHQNFTKTDLGLLVTDRVKVTGITFAKNYSEMQEINYEHKIRSLEHEINQLKSRRLSLLGKVTVIRALLLSKFNYVFQAVSAPPKTIKKIVKLVYKYLWNGADKLSRGIVAKEVKDGGLNLSHPESVYVASQAKWIKNLFDPDDTTIWGQLVRAELESLGGLEALDGRGILNVVNHVIYDQTRDLLNATKRFFGAEPYERVTLSSKLDIWKQIEPNFKYRRKSFTETKNFFAEIGLATVGQLFTTEGKLVTADNFVELGMESSWKPELEAIIEAIPERLATYLKQFGGSLNNHLVEAAFRTREAILIKNEKRLSWWPGEKELYINELTSTRNATDKVQINPILLTQRILTRWANNELKTTAPPFHAKLLPSIPGFVQNFPSRNKIAVLSSRQRSHAFKVQHGLIFCNYELHKFGKRDTAACDWCKNPKADKYHVLCDCPEVERLWTELAVEFPILVNSDNVDKIFGVWQKANNSEAALKNFIIFTTTEYIYQCASTRAVLNAQHLIDKITRTAWMEYENRLHNGKLSKHAIRARAVLKALKLIDDVDE